MKYLIASTWSRKPTGLSNLHTYLKPGKKKKDGVPGRDFFVGEEELMKYLDRVDLDATRKPPGSNPGDSNAATKPRSHEAQASGQSRREAATTERGSGERSQGKDDTGASTELGGEVEKANGPLQPTYVPEAGKEEEGWRPRPRFFVGEEELMKYLDRVDLGTFERYSSASMSSDVAYRYLAQRCYTEATRKQPRRQQRSHTKPRSHEAKQAAKAGRGSGERSQGKDDTGASTELGGEDHSSPVQDEVILAIPAVLSPESGAMTRVVEVSSPQTRRNLTADFGEATSSEVPDTLTAHKSIQSATTSKDAILEDTCNDKEAPCATTETVSGLDTYATLVLEGEDDSRKPTGLSNLHTYLKPGKKKKDGVPGRDFFVGEEELMKYLDRVDLGTFERYSSASMSSDVAYRYLAQRCYTEATRKQPRRQQRSHEATKPRSHEASKRPKQA
ncbi:hypothetical protein GQ600_17545 [Phytophthora cactorum]|nr:hypothetical protein GQ600_17545 [Phytophthora cactorum]